MKKYTKIVTKEETFLAVNIRMLRRNRFLTQEEFAKVIGVSRPIIGAYEESRCVPPLPTLCKIMDYFGVTFEQIYKTEIVELVTHKIKK